MKQKDLLELFISGSVISENVSRIRVDDAISDLKWLVGATDGHEVAHGEYLVYYHPIEENYGERVTPDYTLHDEYEQEIYLLRIEEEPDATRTVSSYFFYMWNAWCEEECKVVFKDDFYPHFWNKWCQACDETGGPRGAAEVFYMMLSDANRERLVRRATELYDGHTEKELKQ